MERVEIAHVIEALTRDDLWTSKPETASQVRGRIEAALAWATVWSPATAPAQSGTVEEPPGHGTAETRQAEEGGTPPGAPIDAALGFLADLRKRKVLAARALEFTLLTGPRSGEVRLATWDAIDF